MLDAVIWGALAASSLVMGSALGVARRWPDRVVGSVLAFGAGALVSAVSFDLAEDGVEIGGGVPVAIGLAVGALTYFAADRALDRWQARSGPGRGDRAAGDAPQATREPGGGAGPALALGAFLDGVPEQLVLGIGIAVSGEVGIGLLAAIFISNLPEAIGSASSMRESGRSPRAIMGLWLAVAAICTSATLVGFLTADNTSGELQAGVNGFAAGALLVMLIDSMVPEARRLAGTTAGLLAVFGFAVAAGLSVLG